MLMLLGWQGEAQNLVAADAGHGRLSSKVSVWTTRLLVRIRSEKPSPSFSLADLPAHAGNQPNTSPHSKPQTAKPSENHE